MVGRWATIFIISAILALFTLTKPPPAPLPEPPSRESRLHIPNPPPLEVSRGVSRNEGTKRANTTDTPQPQPQPIEMVVESTAYSHTGNQTYTGTWPQEGRTIAVDPETIPIGSRVFIEELGAWFVAEDKIPPESVQRGAVIDIFKNCENDCWEWGRRDVTVKVIPPKPFQE